MEVGIDSKPGSDSNSINLGAKGVVALAVLTTGVFDATTVGPGTVVFAGASPLRWAWEDVDYDGDVDVVFFFKTREVLLTGTDIEAHLLGTTFAGDIIHGLDAVRIVPRNRLTLRDRVAGDFPPPTIGGGLFL